MAGIETLSSPFTEHCSSLPNENILDWSILKAYADHKIILTEKNGICFGEGTKHCGNWRKCWSPAFCPLPTMFLKGFLYRVVKSRDFVVNG